MSTSQPPEHSSSEGSSRDVAFGVLYPNIVWWCEAQGWIEIGQDEFSDSMVRVLDVGGTVFEVEALSKSIGEALDEVDEFLEEWHAENG